MSKDTGDINEPIEKSNEIDVIVFCDGYKERKGRCIGFSTENCEFQSLSQGAINDAYELFNERTEPPEANISLRSPASSMTEPNNDQKEKLPPFLWGQHKIASIKNVNRSRQNPITAQNRQNPISACKRQNSSTNGPNLPGIRTAEEIGANA